MAAEDNNITAAARRILSSYWVDLTRLNVRTTRGAIYISGTFKRMTFEHAEMDERMLRLIDSDLKMLDKVRTVNYDLLNWELDAMDVWRRIDPEEQKRRKRQQTQWESSGS